METIPSTALAVGDSEEKNLELSAKIASVNLLFAQQELGKRIIDPTVTTKTLLDVAEHSYKVSGMQKKQEPKQVGPGFSIQIVLPGMAEPVVIGRSSTAEPVELAQLASEAEALFVDSPEF